MDFVYFLGRFHVLMLHIPIGIIVALLILEGLVKREKYRYLQAASPLLWAIGAVSALLTALLGYMHFAEGGFTGPAAYQHRFFGTTLAVLITVIALLRNSRFAPQYAPVFFPAAVLMFLLASITGHLGGNLTHGSNYLIQHAPQPIRGLFGMAPQDDDDAFMPAEGKTPLTAAQVEIVVARSTRPVLRPSRPPLSSRSRFE